MKFWFFGEGDSEYYFVRNLMKKLRPNWHEERDLSFFVGMPLTEADDGMYHYFNCQSVDRIPFRINDNHHLVQRSCSKNAIVVADLEKLPCATSRKTAILQRLESEVDQRVFRYSFSRPYIETIYWDHPDIIKKVLKETFKKKFVGQNVPVFQIPARPDDHFQYHLKELFKSYDLKYREPEFAEYFFPRFDYLSSTNQTVQRLVAFVQTPNV